MITALPGPADWIDAALECARHKERAVLALVTSERGSTPRDTGSWILLTKAADVGTIGGGELERTVIEARCLTAPAPGRGLRCSACWVRICTSAAAA